MHWVFDFDSDEQKAAVAAVSVPQPPSRRDPLRADDDDDYDPLRIGPRRAPQPRLPGYGDFDEDFMPGPGGGFMPMPPG